MKTPRIPLFFLVSIFIAISDGLFVWINYRQGQQLMMQAIQRQGLQAKSTFEMMLNEVSIHMQQVATVLANDPHIQTLFLKGRKAVESEGGGPGGPRAAQVRQELQSRLKSSWQAINKNFDIRQIHFHLAPGDTSFLRLHAPHKFGDDLSKVRHTITHSNTALTPTKGFESGRIYSGIRGVVPVFAESSSVSNGEAPLHIGALEAGTSFKVLLQTMKEELGVDLAVVMEMQHAQETLWPDFLRSFQENHFSTQHHVVENTTSPAIEELLPFWEQKQRVGECYGGARAELQGIPISLFCFGLRDFLGELHPERQDIGPLLSKIIRSGGLPPGVAMVSSVLGRILRLRSPFCRPWSKAVQIMPRAGPVVGGSEYLAVC